jgi:hypothetical protein
VRRVSRRWPTVEVISTAIERMYELENDERVSAVAAQEDEDGRQ